MISIDDNSIVIKLTSNQYIVRCFEIRYYESVENSNGKRITRFTFDKLLKTESEALLYIKTEQEKYMDRNYQYAIYSANVNHDGSLDEATEWFIKSFNDSNK